MPQSAPRSFSDDQQFALVAEPFAETFRFAWFDADHWAREASLVGSGGRGAAWFIDSALGQWVLRHYRRGGLPGRWLTRDYLYLGHERARSISEFRLLLNMAAQGLPVPRPVAAYCRRRGLLYQAALIIERIADAQSLTELKDPDQRHWWRAAGRCIRRFHDKGVYHADLNTDNILIAPDSGTVYLIDFDRGRYHQDRRAEAPWKQANLARLKRSAFKKGTQTLPPDTVERLVADLRSGYEDTALTAGEPEARD